MDAETFGTILDNLADVSVKADGTILDHNGDEFSPEDIADAIAGFEGKLAELRKILAWAKLAPLAQPQTVSD